MIKSITYRFLAAIALLALAACTEYDDATPVAGEATELSGLSASMSRATEVAELKDYVGKDEFDDQDRIVFETIKRTSRPISQFTYKEIEFVCKSSTSPQGVTSIGWSRDKTKGTTELGSDHAPDRIYWSDATNDHTFIGYCAPQQGEGKPDFDWKKSETGYFYGSIGLPTETGMVDFRSTFDAEGNETLSGNAELRRNDILLTYSQEIKAADAIAKLYFYHGLAQVRVIVNISDFAAGGGDDTKSSVSDMILRQMLMMYKWRQMGVATEELQQSDQSIIDGLYQGSAPAYDKRRDVNLWIPKPEGEGKGSSRTFTFYGLAVPTVITDTEPLDFSFTVSYPNPMKPDEMKEHVYNASIDGIRFDAGKCTTISISLNHKNEKMTVGAQYDDWDFVDSPDQGSLKKNSTFLQSTERNSINILGDAKATVDDATWLYVDTTDVRRIKDIYGNDGSAEHPFQISTADQLLAFAYEVKGTNRQSVSYMGLDGETNTLSGAFDFTGYNVALDAGITLQATEKKTKKELELQNPNIDKTSSEYTNAPSTILNWIGIGEAGKPFNGNFLGGVRLISRLSGAPFFMELGPKAHVGQLILENVIEVDGEGGFAEVNRGVICACKVDGKVTSSATTKPVGSLVGTNHGLVFACYHVGDLAATSASVVGGLIGLNNGTGSIVASYNYGKITGKSGGVTYGILGQFDRLAGAGEYSSVFGCYYDNTKASNVTAAAPATALSSDYPSEGMPTVDIMRSTFAGMMNDVILRWVTANQAALERLGQDPEHFKSHHYVSQPANYPYVY